MIMKNAVLAAALLAAPTLFAQEITTPEKAPRDPRFQERRAAPRAPVLTPEERAKIQEITQKTQPEQRALSDKLRTLRRELNDLAHAEKVDEAAVRAKAAELGTAEADLVLLRGRQYQELKAVLPEEKLRAWRAFPGLTPGPAAGPQLQQRLQTVTPRTPEAAKAVETTPRSVQPRKAPSPPPQEP